MNKFRFRWILLSTFVVWALLAIGYVSVTTRRADVSFAVTLIPAAMLLAALAPLSVTRIATHRWAVPIVATWGSSAIIATHFIGRWLTGFGQECDRVVLTASIAAFCLLNGCWAGNRLWRRLAAFERRKLAWAIQAAVV